MLDRAHRAPPRRCRARARGSASCLRRSPCSPVQVPSIAMARSRGGRGRPVARAHLVGVVHHHQHRRSGSCRRRRARRSARRARSPSMSRLVSMMHSARREIGTQTSVTIACAPGRKDLLAQKTWWRAAQRRFRSSARVAHSNAAVSEVLRDLAEPLRLFDDAGLGAVKFEEEHRRLRRDRAWRPRCRRAPAPRRGARLGRPECRPGSPRLRRDRRHRSTGIGRPPPRSPRECRGASGSIR